MESQRGITLTSVAIYITIVLIVIGILAVITANLQGNIQEIYSEGTNDSEIDKFNVYFLKEVNKQGNEVQITPNEALFSSGNKYTFKEEGIYLNDNIKIAENIEKCVFFSKQEENGKTVITVTIKAINGEERSIEYVLGNGTLINNYEDENDYTNYEIPSNWDTTKLNSDTPVKIGMIDGTINIAPIPKGFEISTNPGESTIAEGLVITDGQNEFVWIPVNDAETYEEDSFGPLTGNYTVDDTTIGAYDSYETIQYLYGDTLGEMTDETSFNETFTYEQDKSNVEESIQTYGGFYVGRYETTYDSTDTNGVPQGIGVKQGKNVLQSNSKLKGGKTYRWWGLYKVQKDMYVEDEIVGSLMISSKQWDAIMTFTDYGDTIRETDTYNSKPDLSASAYIIDTTQYDKAKNVYDLAGNVWEFTLKSFSTSYRSARGGAFANNSYSASRSLSQNPNNSSTNFRFSCSTLYKIDINKSNI